MSTYQVTLNQSTKQVMVQANGRSVQTGFTKLSKTFDHPDPIYPGSYVMVHGVRNALYHTKDVNPPVDGFWPDNITDADRIDILLEQLVTSLAMSAATANLAVAATKQLSVTVVPSDATNTAVTWSTSDATKATVSAAGLVTGVAAGTATITATAADGSGKTATCAVTVA